MSAARRGQGVSASTARAAAIFALVVAAASPAAARAAPEPGASPSASPAASEGPLVVVDAGHGGDKTGAKTRAGVNEKDVTLAVARAAKAKLEALGFRVIMTRDDDLDVKLADRILRANRERAAVFVSIHANWSPVPSRSGVETYILSADASDEDAQAVLHLENDEGEADTGGGKRADGGDLSFILGDLERTQAHQDAAKLAKAVQAAVSGVKGLGPSRGLRQAPFLVLRGAEMPAILVELGYLSNAAQGALLASEATQQAAGEAVARGVAAFAKARRSTR